MKRLIKSSLIGLLLISSFSCSNDMYGENVSNNYLDVVPYLNIEKDEINTTLKDINGSEYLSKINNKDTFVCLFYSVSCSACNALKEHYLLPYINETHFVIYGLDIFNENTQEHLLEIKNVQPSDSDYLYLNSENKVQVKRPLLQIVDSGEVKVYELGVSKNSIYMLDSYLIK